MHNEPLQKPEDSRQAPWNKGKLIGWKPPLRTDVWSIRTKLQGLRTLIHVALVGSRRGIREGRKVTGSAVVDSLA
jgi:hypothetical protein